MTDGTYEAIEVVEWCEMLFQKYFGPIAIVDR